jgi:hypothetical protein
LTLAWSLSGSTSFLSTFAMACDTASTRSDSSFVGCCQINISNHEPLTSGWANITMSSGRTSGTPPTRVLTTNNLHLTHHQPTTINKEHKDYYPAHAASNMPIQNASVKEVFRNICPLTRTWIILLSLCCLPIMAQNLRRELLNSE